MGILKSRKMAKVARENGLKVLTAKGVSAWIAYVFHKIINNEETRSSFKEKMKVFYFDEQKDVELAKEEERESLSYGALKSSDPKLTKRLRKILSEKGINVDAMLDLYKEDIIDSEMCYWLRERRFK